MFVDSPPQIETNASFRSDEVEQENIPILLFTARFDTKLQNKESQYVTMKERNTSPKRIRIITRGSYNAAKFLENFTSYALRSQSYQTRIKDS